ncbi:unnamed protein product [Gulo gulo]|uniref:Uncharacterized protein n=1 Tax=Gulo gulo TaxID=48420 RepID=A0A9X9LCH0_GULGU|nr:unnamed protein product [Gulo gulo]
MNVGEFHQSCLIGSFGQIHQTSSNDSSFSFIKSSWEIKGQNPSQMLYLLSIYF